MGCHYAERVTELLCHLGKSHKKELIVGQVDCRKALLLSILLHPWLIGLKRKLSCQTYGLMWKSALFPSGVWFGTTLKLQWTNTKCFICTKEKSETCYKTLCFLNLICLVFFLRWITATAVRTKKDFLRHRYHCVWDHRITHVQTNMVCCLQSSVVCDVFSKRLFSIDMFSVNKIAAVLIHHTLCSLPKCLHRRVLPPRPQVTIFIILTTWWQEEGHVQ